MEDHDDAREMMAELVTLAGAVPLPAATAEEALRIAFDSVPDLGLLDLGLPDVDGFEIARRLRADPRCRGMRLIALSGFTTARDRELAERAGFDGFHSKPVDAELLMKLVQST